MNLNRKQRKVVVGLLGVAVVVALAVIGVRQWQKSSRAVTADKASTAANALATLRVEAQTQQGRASFDGVVESVRQSLMAAQVAGSVKEIAISAGDKVSAGQVLLRLDGQAAEQAALAARAEYQRQSALYQRKYISEAALEQAKVALAQATAQSGFYVIRAPFSGVVTEVHVKLGEMAMPGMPLLTMYDPKVMRVSARVPQMQLAQVAAAQAVQVELSANSAAGGKAAWLTPSAVEVLPAVDAKTQSGTVRMRLPSEAAVMLGAFARVWVSLPNAATTTNNAVWIPQSAVMRRGELWVVYVKTSEGRFLMRQLRLGASLEGQVQVISGLNQGEEIAQDPQAAANLTQPSSQ